MKYTIELCDNGFIVTIRKRKDEFVARYVFTDAQVMMAWLTSKMVGE